MGCSSDRAEDMGKSGPGETGSGPGTPTYCSEVGPGSKRRAQVAPRLRGGVVGKPGRDLPPFQCRQRGFPRRCVQRPVPPVRLIAGIARYVDASPQGASPVASGRSSPATSSKRALRLPPSLLPRCILQRDILPLKKARGLRRFRTSDLRSGDPPASCALMCGRCGRRFIIIGSW